MPWSAVGNKTEVQSDLERILEEKIGLKLEGLTLPKSFPPSFKVGDTRNQHLYVSQLYKHQEWQNVAFKNFQKKNGERMGSKTLY